MKQLVPELRDLYKIAAKEGKAPSAAFVKLGQWLKAGAPCPKCRTGGSADREEEAETLYQETEPETIEKWLEAVETNIECKGHGGTEYSDKEVEFIEDMRSLFEERRGRARPLTGKQLRWLKSLYDRS
jgi:hypothetical protein